MAELKKTKTAIVGCGAISHIYCKNLKNMYHVFDLVALCDIFPEAAKKRAEEFGIEKTMTMEELLADPEIELVINLTGPAQHYEVIAQLLSAGKNVYTEKPLAATFEQGKELVELAKAKGVRLGCAPDTYFGAPWQTAIGYMDKGLIGKITSFNIQVSRDIVFFSETMRMLRGAGGTIPYDQGPYFLNVLIAMFGPIKKVAGFSHDADPHQGTIFGAGNYGESWQLSGPNLMAATLQFKNGVIGTILFDGGIPTHQAKISINGTKGTIELGSADQFDGTVTLIQNGKNVEIPNTHGFKGTPIYGDPLPRWDWGADRGAGAAEMVFSIQLGRTHRNTGEMGLHVIEVLDGIGISSQSGKTYTMTTSCERPRPLPAGFTEVTPMGMSAEASLMF